MLSFDIITIFPHIFDSYLKESILGRAQKEGLIKIRIHNLRDYSSDKHKTVDDKPYGGGPGMVMMVEPIYKATEAISHKGPKAKIVLLSPRGKKFSQAIAKRFSTLNQLVLICGRYEGVDERVAKYIADEVISVGDYILSGGEVAAMIIVEAVSRLVPGVLGNKESISTPNIPQYTRPAVFKTKKGEKWEVPKILLSGNHQKIRQWRKERKNTL